MTQEPDLGLVVPFERLLVTSEEVAAITHGLISVSEQLILMELRRSVCDGVESFRTNMIEPLLDESSKMESLTSDDVEPCLAHRPLVEMDLEAFTEDTRPRMSLEQTPFVVVSLSVQIPNIASLNRLSHGSSKTQLPIGQG